MEELITAASSYDVPALTAIFGPDGKDLITSADPVQDKNYAAAFARRSHGDGHVVKISPSQPSLATVVVGQEQWPLPVPLIKEKWEMVFRRQVRQAAGPLSTNRSQ